ncbi:MAG: hypothetical protein GYB66_12845, partial [Chloroflexi bacterium]|nr:hypothetical protein [Chloroflexota bacterium]
GNPNRPEIAFWHSWDLNYNDYIYVEMSTDRQSWTALRTGPADSTDYLQDWGTETQMVQVTVDIPPSFWGLATTYVRFRLVSDDDSYQAQGWWIDDIEFRNRTSDTVTPNWCDNMDGTSAWFLDGQWNLTTAEQYSGLYSLSDSPVGNYAAYSNSAAELKPYIDLSAPTLTRPILEFWHKYNLGYDSEDDIFVELSLDDGDTWPIAIWAFRSDYAARPPGYGTSINADDYRFANTMAWNRTEVELTPFLGIPAPSDPIPGLRLRFRLDARTGGSTYNGWFIDNVCIKEHIPRTTSLPFADDLEAGPGNWIPGGDWKLATTSPWSGNWVFSDSDGGYYRHNTHSILELEPTVDLNGVTNPTLYYWERYNLSYDDIVTAQYRLVQANGAPLSSWEVLPLSTHYRSTNKGWTRQQIDLSPYAGNYIRLRFMIDALENSSVADGWYIDDVAIVERNNEPVYDADPYYDDMELLTPGKWVFEHQWDRVQTKRDLGSGGSLGPGQWTVDWYDNVFNDCESDAEIDFTSKTGSSVVDEINANWGSGIPAGSGLTDNDFWGAVYRRTFFFGSETTFTFSGEVEDGLRIYDNPAYSGGVPIDTPFFEFQWQTCGNDDFNTETETYSPSPTRPFGSPYSYTFSPGIHTIEVHYYKENDSAEIALSFAGDSWVFHDSPSGNTQHLTMSSVELEGQIDLSGMTNPVLLFDERRNIEFGDSRYIDISLDGGYTWSEIWGGGGTDWDWSEPYIDLSSYAGMTIGLRFRMDARSHSQVGDGWWIDNIRILE